MGANDLTEGRHDLNDLESQIVVAVKHYTRLSTENEELTELAREFNVFITSQLTSTQLERLRQIVRQEQLPFTFKSSEVVAALRLTQQQRSDISRIIEQTRPNRGDDGRGGSRGKGKDGPGHEGFRNGTGHFGGSRPRMDDHHGPQEFGGSKMSGPTSDGFRNRGPLQFERAWSSCLIAAAIALTSSAVNETD